MTDNQKLEMLTPALIGGAVAGVLSGLPILSLANCFCCLWIICGAALAVHLTANTALRSLKPGDGAIVGILTGIVAAIVQALVSIPMRGINAQIAKGLLERVAKYAEDMPAGWDSFIQQNAAGGITPVWFLLGLIVSAVLFAAFGALGGIIGVSLFGRKKSPVPGAENAPQNPGHSQP